jgi:hypothetical protein
VEEQQIITNKAQKLIERIKKAGWRNCDVEYMAQLVEERINELQENGVNGVDMFVQKLLDRAGNKQEYLDILIEGRFAVVLARNNFLGIEIEACKKGPDLKAIWNRKTIYFEITRKRPKEDEISSHTMTEAYWVKPAGSEDVIGKIKGKLRQLMPDKVNIVVLWSDTPAWSERSLAEAHKYIKQEIDYNPNSYRNLSAILFTTGGVEQLTLKQFFLFKNDKASKLLGPRLAKKLGSLHEQNLGKLQRDKKGLEDAWTRLKKTKDEPS